MSAKGVKSINSRGLKLHPGPYATADWADASQRQRAAGVSERAQPATAAAGALVSRDGTPAAVCVGAQVSRSVRPCVSNGSPGGTGVGLESSAGVQRCAKISPLIDGWEIAGAAAGEPLGGDELHEWFVHTDGQLSLSVGRAYDSGVNGWLVMAAVGGALRAQRDDGGNPARVAERINRALWTGSAGDQWASLFHAEIEPDTGVIDFVAAGAVSLWILRAEEVEAAGQDEPPLGMDPSVVYRMARRRLASGEVLVVAAGRVGQQRCATGQNAGGLAAGVEPARWRGRPAAEIVGFWRAQSRRWPGAAGQPAAVLVAKRAR